MPRLGQSLQQLAAEIERRAESKRDFIAPTPKFEMALSAAGLPEIAIPSASQQFPIQPIAHGQIAEYAGIPAAYYKRMQAADPTLLAVNVNRWLKDKPDERRMVRTLDGQARAVLSDRYRSLENEDLAEAVLPVLLDMDLIIVSAEITERRLYIKAIDKRIQRDVPTGRAMGDGSHVFFDTCSPAITVSNSEVGYGALSIETGVYTKACTNLAMIGTNLRKYHTGARAAISDDVYALLTDQTKKATDRAVWMQVRDLVKGAFDEARFAATCKQLGQAADDRIEPEETVQVVEKAARRFSFNEGERRGILARLIEGGDLSRYGLHSAITRHSQDEAIDYDRATEMERIGGEVIEMNAVDWIGLGGRAAQRNRELAPA